MADSMKFARLWGHSRFDGQLVPKTEPLHDRDIVETMIKTGAANLRR